MARLVFRLAVACEGDAFKPAPVPEVVSILRTLADKIEAGYMDGITEPRKVRDITGATVGTVQCHLEE